MAAPVPTELSRNQKWKVGKDIIVIVDIESTTNVYGSSSTTDVIWRYLGGQQRKENVWTFCGWLGNHNASKL